MKRNVAWLLSMLSLPTAQAVTQQPFQRETAIVRSACAEKQVAALRSVRIEGAYADKNIDVTYYGLDLILRPSPPLLRGGVTVSARSLSDTLRNLTLDLNGGMRVDSVRAGGVPLSFVQYPFGMGITLDRIYPANELFTVEVFYQGTPAVSGFGSFLFTSQNGVPWIWSLSEPYGAHEWWPCKDNTQDKADSVDIRITCPANLKAGSNGRLVGVQINGGGTQTFHWSERYPIAPYLVSIAVSNYEEFTDWFRYSPTDSMPVLNYVLPQSLATARPALRSTVEMLQVFSDLFGLYPFVREKYGHAQFGWGGAMEHQTMTSTSNFAEYTIAHELAHQWFGDMITCANWPSLWLNEGFATYCETLWGEIKHGEQEYRAHLRDMMSPALRAEGTLYVEDTSSVASLFAFDRVYARGAWVLHMLRRVLGDSTFFAALRAYAADPRFRYGSATTEGFQSVCEGVSGKSLAYFFDEWVYGEGYPRYTLDWTVAGAGTAHDVTLDIGQTVTGRRPAFFTMPVDIGLSDGTNDTTIAVMHTRSGESFTLRIPFKPTSVTLDPDLWILRDPNPPGRLPAAFALAQNFPNPFNPGTSIAFSLPRRTDVTLAVYDLLGREVSLLVRGRMEAGSYTVPWDGVDDAGRRVASGVYIYRLVADDFARAKTMLLLR
ncbi:MAG: M1 family aminopeptidase [Bacteroidota bacterium]